MSIINSTILFDVSESTTVSTSIQVEDFVVFGFYTPSSFTTADITIQVSYDDTNWADLPSDLGQFTSIGTSHYQPICPYITYGAQWFRLVSGTAQGADRTITLAVDDITN